MKKIIDACKTLGYSAKTRGAIVYLSRFYDPYQSTVKIVISFKNPKPLVKYSFINERFSIIFHPIPIPKSRIIPLVFDRIPTKLVALKIVGVL